MSLCENKEQKLTEEKILNFEERMKNPQEMSELIKILFDKEYTKKFPNILLYSKKLFLSQIKKNTISSLENIFTKKIKDKQFQTLIENSFKQIEELYDSNNNILKDIWSNLSKNDGNQFLTKYIKHCFFDNEYANHNCQNNSKFILILNKDKIEFVICNICHKVYNSKCILCKCYYCEMEYYTEIINEENESFLFPITWKKNHCTQLIKNKILCKKCNFPFLLNMKTGILNCSNNNCKFISEPKNIEWKCNICNNNFNSDVIIYNPLYEELIEKEINLALLIKKRAFPHKIPCCDLDVFLTEFYHNKNCNGILYLGNLNDDLIIVCEKCHYINYYENFIWTCPKCQKEFNNKNINENKEKIRNFKDIHIKDHKKFYAKNIKEENENISKIEKYNSKETLVNNDLDNRKSLKKKYKSFRTRRDEINEQKKNSVNPITTNIVKNSNISKLKLHLKNYNSSANIEKNDKPKRFSKYKSTKFDLKKFKIDKDFAKVKEKEKEKEDSQKENKNLLNKINNIEEADNNSNNNNLKLESINVEQNQKIIKVRRSIYQYYKNLRTPNIEKPSNEREEKSSITTEESKEIKPLTQKEEKEEKIQKEEKEEKEEKDKSNNYKILKKKFWNYIDRNNFRRKTVQNQEIKLNINEINKTKERLQTESLKNNKVEKEFISHLNIEEHKEDDDKKEKKEKKENTNGSLVGNKNTNSTKDTNSPSSKSLKVSKIPGMSDDLYSQIIQQINALYSSCHLPRFNIEEYTINRKLGEGSYGIIHCIIKEDTKEKFALKKIIAQSLQKVTEFVKEFELVNLCQHPNILKIYGLNINLLEHSTYSIQVLMEKAERDWNKDIKRRMQEEKYYTEKELLSIMKQLTLALLYLKEKLNIAHRDIKPQNVLIFENGIFKLADFGEAKEVKLSKELNTLRGTELYMSPSLYNGLKENKDDIEHNPFKSDLFSLGFCFVYAATMDFNLLYDLRNINNDIDMKKKLNEYLKNKYSEKFIWILGKMVELNETNRFDFNELNSEIDKLIKNEEN